MSISIDLYFNCPVDTEFSKEASAGNCSNCSIKLKKVYRYHGTPYKLCELCNTLYRYSERSLAKGVICLSNISQLEIVNQTYEFLKKNKRVPKISEIDPNAKIVKHSFPDLLHVMRASRSEVFTNVKLFFTDMFDHSNLYFASMFWKPKRYADYQFFEIIKQETESVALGSEQLAIWATHSGYATNKRITKKKELKLPKSV